MLSVCFEDTELSMSRLDHTHAVHGDAGHIQPNKMNQPAMLLDPSLPSGWPCTMPASPGTGASTKPDTPPLAGVSLHGRHLLQAPFPPSAAAPAPPPRASAAARVQAGAGLAPMSAQQQAELQDCLRQSQQNGTASALSTLAPAAISALQSFLNTHGCLPLFTLRHMAVGLAEHARSVAHGWCT